MTIRLIVNADDYGRTPEVSRGIREAHLNGIVTSTTVMMNQPQVESDLHMAAEQAPNLGLGVHLVLTSGRPVLPAEMVPSLVQPDGVFHNLFQFTPLRNQVAHDEVEAEWRAQLEKFTAITGKNPTHLDSHHHSSFFTRDLFSTMLELAREYHCAIRMAMVQKNVPIPIGMPEDVTSEVMEFAPGLVEEFKPPHCDDFYATFYDFNANIDEALRIIHSLPEGTHEMMCHPGYTDDLLAAGSIYNSQRDDELKVLTDPRLKNAVQERGIELVTYAAVCAVV